MEQTKNGVPKIWLCLCAGSGGPRVKLSRGTGVAGFKFLSRGGRFSLPAGCCRWLVRLLCTSLQEHLCHALHSLSDGVSCPPVQSSTQEIGEELEDGVIYSISLRKVQLHHTANKGQRWLGVSWGLCQPLATGCFQMFPCQRRGYLMSGLGKVDTSPCPALFLVPHTLLSWGVLPSLIWESCIYLGAGPWEHLLASAPWEGAQGKESEAPFCKIGRLWFASRFWH